MTVESFPLTGSGPAAARRSPLAHREAELSAATSAGLSLSERAFDTVLNLRTESVGELPGAGQTALVEGWHALWLGPDEWLLVGEEGAEPPRGEGWRLVDVSANYATLLISGRHARDLLEKAITLDLHPRSFSTGNCATTTFARGNVVLWQVQDEAYRLLFRPSFGTYFVDWLIDAAQEFGAYSRV